MTRRSSAPSQEQSQETPGRGKDLTVFIAHNASTCAECKEVLGSGSWTFLVAGGVLCLPCADLDHLAFLPVGNAALSRRAKKYSPIAVVVLEFHRRRRRYQRQGLLVVQDSLKKAEAECLADAEVRQRRRAREALRREALDVQFVAQFAKSIRKRFPGCPAGREQAIAEHACRKYSNRVGRSAAAKEFDDQAIHLAVAAHIRHVETSYDRLLDQGHERHEARQMVASQVARTLHQWSQGSA